MSLICYDFEKWTIISLAMVAITLTIGLISIAYGQTNQTKIPYLNCVYFYSENNRVTLQLNEMCDENQFNEAKEYYEANGYPIESFYYGMTGTMGLDSIQFHEFMYGDKIK